MSVLSPVGSSCVFLSVLEATCAVNREINKFLALMNMRGFLVRIRDMVTMAAAHDVGQSAALALPDSRGCSTHVGFEFRSGDEIWSPRRNSHIYPSTFCVVDDAVALELANLRACGPENAVSEIRFALTPPLHQCPQSLWMERQWNKLVVEEGQTNIVRRTISSNPQLWPGFRSHHSRKSPRCPTTKTLLAAPRGLKCGGGSHVCFLSSAWNRDVWVLWCLAD